MCVHGILRLCARLFDCTDTPHPPIRSTPTMLKCLRLVKSDRKGMLKCLLRPIELLKEFLLLRISDVVDLQLRTRLGISNN